MHPAVLLIKVKLHHQRKKIKNWQCIKAIGDTEKTRAAWQNIVMRIANRILSWTSCYSSQSKWLNLTEITIIHPQILFSLEGFKDVILFCFKGSINIYYKDLLRNSFTQKIHLSRIYFPWITNFPKTRLFLGN